MFDEWVAEGYDVWFRTGDFGRIVDGNIFYEGRSDSQVKIRGHRVDLAEINQTVGQLDLVESSVVLCYQAGQVEQVFVSLVVHFLTIANINWVT